MVNPSESFNFFFSVICSIVDSCKNLATTANDQSYSRIGKTTCKERF